MGLIALGILIGCVVFVVALIAKKRGCAIAALPCPVLVLLWLVMVATPPNAEFECERLFGRKVLHSCRELQSLKPAGMEGFLLSFRISEDDFRRLVKQSFSTELLGGIRFFGGATRPESWPKVLDTLESCLQREVGEDKLLLYYNENTEMAYARYVYLGW
jgi:hypothetical protein